MRLWIAMLLSCAEPIGMDASITTDAGFAADAADEADANQVDSAVPEELSAEAGESRYAIVGEEVVLDGSASTGAVAYQWHFGNGTGQVDPSSDPIARVAYAAPGRYRAVLTVFDAEGVRKTDQAVISVTDPPSWAPQQSGTIAVLGDAIAVVSPDSDELTLVRRTGDAFAVEARWPTPDEPRTVTAFGDRFAVACQDDQIALFGLDGTAELVSLPYGSRPYGIVSHGDVLYVSLQGTGALVELTEAVRILPAIRDARGVAVLPGGRIAVTRWRSPDDRGEIAIVDPKTGTATVTTLAFDPQPSSDTEIGGVPSYLDQILVSPNGREVALPSTQVNVRDGVYRNGIVPRQDTVLRAVVSFLELPTYAEDFERRKQFDERGMASAAAWSVRGDYLYAAMRGNRTIERFDWLGSTQSGTLPDVGFAVQGLAVTPDDRFLLVDAYLSRELVIYASDAFRNLDEPVARLSIPSAEPLDPTVLLGKQLFNDSSDPRISRDGYIACAHCHLEADTDNRVWDFTDRGEGLRNTISMLGRAGDGPIHWSGNFDEIQDFEHDIRAAFGGSGLMSDADFHSGTRDQTLGDPKAGISPELDALAAYSATLSERRSPFRDADGSVSPAALRGQTIFAAAGCSACHFGPRLTDSQFETPAQPRLHDVGTLGPASGQRLGAPLLGIDTPSLLGLWYSAPYLHDGSAATLREVLTVKNADDRHGTTSNLDGPALSDLEAYLLSL